MPDDLIEVAIDLLGDAAELLLKGRARKKKPSSPPSRVTAARKKSDEDPWDWKEPPPPWER